MSAPPGIPRELAFYLTNERPCVYLPVDDSRTLFADPQFSMTPSLYGLLLDYGFRRSGNLVYRPNCATCLECVPIRVPVARFRPDRSQRRTMARNGDLTLDISPATDSDEIGDLYRRYMDRRHHDSGMADQQRDYMEFLSSAWARTEFWTFRHAGRALAVAVVDRLPHALSAVYTFDDPSEQRRGLGTLAVLTQIAQALASGLPHVYLGYWIEGHRKMDYKRRYRPGECLSGSDWQDCPG